jgi:hypothetical protein
MCENATLKLLLTGINFYILYHVLLRGYDGGIDKSFSYEPTWMYEEGQTNRC